MGRLKLKSMLVGGELVVSTLIMMVRGALRLASSPEDVEAAAQAMLGRILVTRQTGPEGRRVNRVYVERSCHSVRECYLCVFM